MTDSKPDQQNPAEERDTAQAELDRAMVNWTRMVGIFTGLLALVSAVTGFFVLQQWRVAAASQADFREQLRAVVSYVGAVTAEAQNEKGEVSGYNFFTQYQNSGGSRTGWFHGWQSVKYFQDGIPDNLDLSKPYNPISPPDAVMGPNGVTQMGPSGIPQGDVTEALNKKGQILLWGHAEYTDVFNPKAIHPVSFCSLVTPVKGAAGKVSFATQPYRQDCNKNQ